MIQAVPLKTKDIPEWLQDNKPPANDDYNPKNTVVVPRGRL